MWLAPFVGCLTPVLTIWVQDNLDSRLVQDALHQGQEVSCAERLGPKDPRAEDVTTYRTIEPALSVN